MIDSHKYTRHGALFVMGLSEVQVAANGEQCGAAEQKNNVSSVICTGGR